MAIPVINDWEKYFDNYDEGLGSSYERVVLNNLLDRMVKEFDIQSVLEAPCFGFTGISGINSMDLAKKGIDVTIIDNNGKRIKMVEEIWELLGHKATLLYSDYFDELPFSKENIDMSWNFSAMWFVKDIKKFLGELSRVTSKIILIIVPNTTGLGYGWQKINSLKKRSKVRKGKQYNPKWIKKSMFKPILQDLGWKLKEHGLIDCPPWPDIGMKKEDFLRVCGLKSLLDEGVDKGKAISIIDYYSSKDKHFPEKMMKYYWFEKTLPVVFKYLWAHHHYYLFIRQDHST